MMTGRRTPEWIGKTPDAKVPPRVRARIFLRDEGRCHISGRRIGVGEPWQLDHIVALCNGGEHRESNLAPALADKHRQKTAADVAEKARVSRQHRKHIGIRAAARPMPGSRRSRWRKRMDGSVERRNTVED